MNLKNRNLKGNRSAPDPSRGRIDKHELCHVYRNMLTRALNDRFNQYGDYGGRGIDVCERWQESFWNFVDDMGERPEGYTLERVDNDRGYSPDNCIWASLFEQGQNKRRYRNAKDSKKFITKTGVRGVTRHSNGEYVARHTVCGERRYLGHFPTLLQAVEALSNAKHKAN